MFNPYENVDWNNHFKIASLSHAHCANDRSDRFLMYYNGGIRHFGLSNYYPSMPYYPLSNFFTDIEIPNDVIPCPNAEHHGLYLNGAWNAKLHINGVASFYSSNPNAEQAGINEHWKYCIDGIIDNLQFQDGGGATINHPVWTGLSLKNACEILDYDERVLGIEIYSGDQDVSGLGDCTSLWDKILLTGRRCFGFCVPDHDVETQEENFRGRNILLCNEASEYECAKAYREGRFYGSKFNTSLKFNYITFENQVLSVSTTDAENICVIVDGKRTIYSGNEVSIMIPNKAIYVRVEATTDNNILYSQPIMISNKPKKTKNIMMWY